MTQYDYCYSFEEFMYCVIFKNIIYWFVIMYCNCPCNCPFRLYGELGEACQFNLDCKGLIRSPEHRLIDTYSHELFFFSYNRHTLHIAEFWMRLRDMTRDFWYSIVASLRKTVIVPFNAAASTHGHSCALRVSADYCGDRYSTKPMFGRLKLHPVFYLRASGSLPEQF